MFGNYKLSSITPLMVKEMRNKIKETSTIATANRYKAVLRSIFNRDKDWKLFYGENPAAVEKLEKEAPNRLRYLSTEEIPLLLAACSREIYPVVVCALLTGMRRGEILGLKWDDVDLTERIIYLTETKSGKPREIPIMQKLYDTLIDMPRDGAFVFNVTKITLRSRFETALKQAGITGFRFHDLRHTFASHFIMRTSALPALQKILGHSTPILTQRYAHLSNKHLRVNMELLDAEWTPIWTPSPAEILPAFPKNANISNGVTQ
jgi:integrase